MAGEAAGTLDWPALMRLGLGGLRLPPGVFWSMTPNELMLALEGAGIVPVAGAGPMEGARLAELMARFPDEVAADGIPVGAAEAHAMGQKAGSGMPGAG